jgi:hypothetical protein
LYVGGATALPKYLGVHKGTSVGCSTIMADVQAGGARALHVVSEGVWSFDGLDVLKEIGFPWSSWDRCAAKWMGISMVLSKSGRHKRHMGIVALMWPRHGGFNSAGVAPSIDN